MTDAETTRLGATFVSHYFNKLVREPAALAEIYLADAKLRHPDIKACAGRAEIEQQLGRAKGHPLLNSCVVINKVETVRVRQDIEVRVDGSVLKSGKSINDANATFNAFKHTVVLVNVGPKSYGISSDTLQWDNKPRAPSPKQAPTAIPPPEAVRWAEVEETPDMRPQRGPAAEVPTIEEEVAAVAQSSAPAPPPEAPKPTSYVEALRLRQQQQPSNKAPEAVVAPSSDKPKKAEQKVSPVPQPTNDRVSPPPEQKAPKENKWDRSPPTFMAFVRNLPSGCTEEELVGLLSPHCHVRRPVKLDAKSDDKGARTFAFINFVLDAGVAGSAKQPEAVSKIVSSIQKLGLVLRGAKIHIDMAKDKFANEKPRPVRRNKERADE